MQWLDPDFIFQTVLPALNRGLVMSIALIVPSATIGFVLGVLTGVARVFGPKWLRSLGNGFTTIFRGVPLVVQLMILYFGLPNLGIYLEPYPASVLGFILCTGAYQSEYVRGALLSIRQGQIKAAYALGFTKLQTILWVVIPQAARRALPGCGNEIIYLIKYSSLAYIITCIELTGRGQGTCFAFVPAHGSLHCGGHLLSCPRLLRHVVPPEARTQVRHSRLREKVSAGRRPAPAEAPPQTLPGREPPPGPRRKRKRHNEVPLPTE